MKISRTIITICALSLIVSVSAKDSIQYAVNLMNPVVEDGTVSELKVDQLLDDEGLPSAYAIQVFAESCDVEPCKRVNAKLYWSLAGRYIRFEVDPKESLTKKNNKIFSNEDYSRLHEILMDKNSVLGDQSLAYLGRPNAAVPKPDGISGATPKTIQRTVVKDAAWTTWIMWQYANGELPNLLKEITEESCTPGLLNKMLMSENLYDAEFALDHLITHLRTDGRFVDSVLIALEQGDSGNVGLALKYLDGVMHDKPVLNNRLVDSVTRMDPGYVPMIIRHLGKSDGLSAATMDELSNTLKELPYQPVNAILNFMNERSYNSTTLEKNVLNLLNSSSSRVVERAQEFLSARGLSPGGRKS